LNEATEKRACDLAVYILEHRGTVRSAAKAFGISKSTVHKDISDRLYHINRNLYIQVKALLEINKAERHIRGGMATAQKYRKNSPPTAVTECPHGKR
jgi:putative DeoR family transcriptional regulator (stage III sporulation protein D)